MANFIVRSRKDNPRFEVRLANCSQEHADSVVTQLLGTTLAPDDLYADEVDDLYPTLHPQRKHRPWYRRFF